MLQETAQATSHEDAEEQIQRRDHVQMPLAVQDTASHVLGVIIDHQVTMGSQRGQPDAAVTT